MRFTIRHTLATVAILSIVFAAFRIIPAITIALTAPMLVGGIAGTVVGRSPRGAVLGVLCGLGFAYGFAVIGRLLLHAFISPWPYVLFVVLATIFGGWIGGISARQSMPRVTGR